MKPRPSTRIYRYPGIAWSPIFAGNIKGMLGRYPRPGYTEIDGTRGTIVRAADGQWHAEAEVRDCTDEALMSGGIADQVSRSSTRRRKRRLGPDYVDLPIGRVEYVDPVPPQSPNPHPGRDYYGAAVMNHVVDFAPPVRGVADSEYTDEDASTAMMMEVGARESILRDGGGWRCHSPTIWSRISSARPLGRSSASTPWTSRR